MYSRVGKRFAVALLKGTWIFSLILWAYIVADLFVFPSAQFGPISIHVPIPQDIIALIAFPISFVSFVAWEYLRSERTN